MASRSYPMRPRRDRNRLAERSSQPEDNDAESTNTAFWIRGLPHTTSYRGLFTALRGTGTIRNCRIVQDRPRSLTATAFVQYFKQSDAFKLWELSRTLQFAVNGVYPQVEWHQEPIAEFPGRRVQTRGLLIRGPPSVVNYRVLEELWSGFLQWTKDFYIDSGEGEVLYFFTGWDDECRLARRLLMTDLMGTVSVDYARDTCDCEREPEGPQA
ncbi:hypothetical protein F5Y14DRAFT_447290 [Nemania sp. NC0429]|nr:hypothetical protein F5Y14DRAFT_447290 [Nemania sp. NC0429]